MLLSLEKFYGIWNFFFRNSKTAKWGHEFPLLLTGVSQVSTFHLPDENPTTSRAYTALLLPPSPRATRAKGRTEIGNPAHREAWERRQTDLAQPGEQLFCFSLPPRGEIPLIPHLIGIPLCHMLPSLVANARGEAPMN
jgi:hypothetical protein